MKLKSEKSLKEYLKKLPDDTIIKYYLDVEYSPFPILVIEEYTRRFKRKTKDQIVKDLKFQTRLAKRKAQELGKVAIKNKLVHELTSEKSEEIIKQAKKKGYDISELILQKSGTLKSKLKKSRQSKQKNLDLLEKLGALKKAGIITNKEFQEKKKKILSNI
jgi:hypothetical protein